MTINTTSQQQKRHKFTSEEAALAAQKKADIELRKVGERIINTTEPHHPINERNFFPALRNLEWLVKNYNQGDIKLPEYQRKAVWSQKQRYTWAKNIKLGVAVATFFVYSLPDSEVYWLADGSQRLHATLEILESPEAYGFETRRDVERVLDRCNISVAFMQCQTHAEGYYHFIHLNRGFAPTPAEIYKGFLMETQVGKWLYGELDTQVSLYSNKVVRKPRGKSRSNDGKYTRDNLALFFQYLTRTDMRSYWGVSSANINDSQSPLERQIAEYLKGRSLSEVQTTVREFLEYISKLTDLIIETIKERKGELAPISPALYRHLLHFCIYCRNTAYPTQHRDRIVDYILLCSFEGNARLNFIDSQGKIVATMNAQIGSLSQVPSTVCRILGLTWEKRKTKGSPKYAGSGIPKPMPI